MSYFMAKMHKIRFPLGLCPDPAEGAYSAPPDPLAVFKGPNSKVGEDGKREERVRGEREGKGKRRGEVRGGKGRGQAPKYFDLKPPLVGPQFFVVAGDNANENDDLKKFR